MKRRRAPSESREKNRQHTRGNVVTGCGQNPDSQLQAAIRKAWIYVGRLHTRTEQETVTKFLQTNGIEGDIECEDLPTKGKNKSFKIGIDFRYIDSMQEPNFCPEGVIVQPFRFRFRRDGTGVSL
jgi:hypothetical protein